MKTLGAGAAMVPDGTSGERRRPAMSSDAVGRSEVFQTQVPSEKMYPPPLQRLIDTFMRLPGIGPRQAARFAFFVLKERNGLLDDLARSLKEVGGSVAFCAQCFRTIENAKGERCSFCVDKKRDSRTIAIVEKESDMKNLEATGAFRGLYHVLGGTVSPLDQDSPKHLHLTHLYTRAGGLVKDGTCEVILATNPTTEGDMTALYITRVLEPLQEKFPQLKISKLGRGLSLGAELEFTDEITLKNALEHRI